MLSILSCEPQAAQAASSFSRKRVPRYSCTNLIRAAFSGVSDSRRNSVSPSGGKAAMSQTLHHNGYDGSVEYNAEDRILYGSLLGIRDMVTYEGSDVDSLEANFKAAIEEYLAFCEAEGKTPDRPFKGSFNVRVGADLHKRAALFAE